MLTHLIANENTKIYRRSLLWVELLIFAVIMLLIMIGLNVAVTQGNSGNVQVQGDFDEASQMLYWPGGVQNSLSLNISLGNGLGGLLLIALIGTIVAQEYQWRTIHITLSRGTPRWKVILTRFLALLVPAGLIILVPFFITTIVSGIITWSTFGSLTSLGNVDWGITGLSLILGFYSLLPYMALAFLLAVLTRSITASIVISAGFSLLVEALASQFMMSMGGVMAKIAAALPSGLTGGLFGMLSSQPSTVLFSPLVSALGIAAYSIVLLGLAFLVFQKQDLSA